MPKPKYIDKSDDELMEITPSSIRLRKRGLKEHQRRRSDKSDE